jgi:hypothetical protein
LKKKKDFLSLFQSFSILMLQKEFCPTVSQLSRSPLAPSMTLQISCPACRHSVYFPSFEECDEDFLEGICLKCDYRYALVRTEVASFNSYLESSYRSKYNKQPEYRRVYQLRLYDVGNLYKNNLLQALDFSTLGREERISAVAGDKLLLLYLMQGKVLKDLLWLENSHTGENYLLRKPGARAKSLAFNISKFALAITVPLCILNPTTNKLLLAAAAPTAAGIGTYATMRQRLKERDRQELGRLTSEQQLLSQKHEMEQQILKLQQELNANKKLIRRLKNLQQKMLSAQQELYSRQIDITSKGIDKIAQQIKLSEELLYGYCQIIRMISIEYETSRIAQVLPENVGEKILRQLDELKAIELKKQEMAGQVDPQKLLQEI